MAEPDDTLQEAATLIDSGRLSEGESVLQRLLTASPDQPDALNFLGIIHVQRGEYESGVDKISLAAESRPRDADIRANLGTAFLEWGRIDDAISEFHRALVLDPIHLNALFNLGNAFLRNGAFQEAEEPIRKIVDLLPEFADGHANLGLCLLAQERNDEAASALRRAIAFDPGSATAINNLGLACQNQGKLAEAESHFLSAVKVQPDLVDAHNNIGLIREALDRPDDALASYEKALTLSPDDPEVLLNIGNLHRSAGRWDDAEAVYRRILENTPENGAALNNLGTLLTTTYRPDEGISFLQASLRHRPQNADTMNNLGRAFRCCGRLNDADAIYTRALEADEAHADARFGRAITRLSRGDFATGWADYLTRESMSAADQTLHRSPLDRDLSGKRVLLERDQGLGDEIFFLRFAAMLRTRGATVAYLPDPRLADMLRRAALVDEIISGRGSLPEFDYRIAVGDLPYVLGAGKNDTPPTISLTPRRAEVDRLANELSALGDAPLLGVTWRAGTPGLERSLFKDIGIGEIASALAGIDATVLALQRNPAPGEIASLAEALGRPVHDFTGLNDDLEAMLAMLARLDDYFCVSNTNVHLRLACGRGSRVLVPSPPEFRWMADGGFSPWFPTCTAYRQTMRGEWTDALRSLKADLQEAFGHE